MKNILDKKLSEFEKSEMREMIKDMMKINTTKPVIANAANVSVHKIKRLLAEQSCSFTNESLIGIVKLYQALNINRK